MARSDRTVITSSQAPQPLGAYSLGMSVSPGKLVYIAGQVRGDESRSKLEIPKFRPLCAGLSRAVWRESVRHT